MRLCTQRLRVKVSELDGLLPVRWEGACMFIKSHRCGGMFMALAVCLATASAASATVTFAWEYGETETRCDDAAALLEVQNDSYPDGSLNWSIGFPADLDPLDASATITLTASISADPTSALVSIQGDAEVYANLTEPTSSEANAYAKLYFQLTILIPEGEPYAYSLNDPNDWLVISQSAGDVVVGSDTFVAFNASAAEQQAGILYGRSEPYRLYGGIEVSAHDGVLDGIESIASFMQTVTLQLGPVPEPASLLLLAAGGVFIRRRTQ